MTRHTITHADQVYVGKVFYEHYSPDGRRGLELAPVFVKKFGAIDTADADGICVGNTATAAATLTPTGALVSGGVATFDVPRAVSITSAGDESGINFTFTGTDEYGETVVETVAGPNATTANGKKAFKTITSVAVDGATTSTAGVNVGSADIFGLPIRIESKGDIVGITIDGDHAPTATAGHTVTVADDTTATATTGDVRGTVAPNTAADGSKAFSVLIAAANRDTKANVFGIAQYGG